MLARLDHQPSDTGKIKSLLELSHYYWYVGKAGNLDTCLYLAQRAYQLGIMLHDTMSTAEAVFMRSKVLVEKNAMSEAGRLLSLVYGEARVRLLLVMAEQYINHKPVDIAYLDNALPYATHALELSDSVHSDRWHNECTMLMAKYYFEKSLGLNLIKGLVSQLHGSYTIENDGGVVVTIQFTPRRTSI